MAEEISAPRIVFKQMVHKGIPLFECEIDRIEAMDTFDDDIWLCGYPRSGNTLTQEMTYLIQTLDFGRANSVYLEDRVPWIDAKDDRLQKVKGVDAIEEQIRPRFVKCHLPYDFLPSQLKDGKGRIIYVSRNAKDVFQSYYRIMLWDDQLDTSKETLNTFFENFVKGKDLYGLWTDHIIGYWKKRDDENVLFLKFEDIVKDMPTVIRTIATFLGRTLVEDDVTKICKHCHVNNMRDNPMVNFSYKAKNMSIRQEVGAFINKGEPGVWRNVLTPQMSEQIDDMMKPLDGTGLKYEFS
ncbi:sulfotransferase 1C2A-like [Mya arenaria]|uniref:sulfotransferase 1C2A-like n=1 Tax=Mya arenaria TaxID=6604 RepID=UPI0022E72AA4|nr:sulfotransferase 1C2A-like [Mya arenaria]